MSENKTEKEMAKKILEDGLKEKQNPTEDIGQLKCVWDLGIEHEGDVSNRGMFDDQISIPICDGCFEVHNRIMYLHEQKIDVDIILLLSRSARDELYEAYREVNSEEYKERPVDPVTGLRKTIKNEEAKLKGE